MKTVPFQILAIAWALALTSVKLGLAQSNFNNEFQLAQNPCESESYKMGAQSAMSACVGWQYQRADNTLNQTYQQLKGELSNNSQQLLTNAQLAWIEFKENECSFQRNNNRGRGGSMAAGLQTACTLDLTKRRALDLQTYLDGYMPQSYASSRHYQTAQRLLNQAYQEALSSVAVPQQLQSGQNAWIEFKNANCKFENYQFSSDDNTCLVRVTERRIEQLSELPSQLKLNKIDKYEKLIVSCSLLLGLLITKNVYGFSTDNHRNSKTILAQFSECERGSSLSPSAEMRTIVVEEANLSLQVPENYDISKSENDGKIYFYLHNPADKNHLEVCSKNGIRGWSHH